MTKLEVSKYFVRFYSPGTFVADTRVSKQPIDAWNVPLALKLSESIMEWHGARPYGFRFETWGRTADELDSRIVEKSGMYYIGGLVQTVADLEGDPKNNVLIANMKGNGWDRVITSIKGYQWTQPLHADDIVLLGRG